MVFKVGNIPWNRGIKALDDERVSKFVQAGHRASRGRKFTYEQKKRISEALKGKRPKNLEQINRNKAGNGNPMWRGDSVGYSGLHRWVRKIKGTPLQCSRCGVSGTKNGTKWSIHWANKSHRYLRILEDWIALCMPCHKKYDRSTKTN